jgi:hypothetical protein
MELVEADQTSEANSGATPEPRPDPGATSDNLARRTPTAGFRRCFGTMPRRRR